jgi:hypothetical protein
MKIADRSTPLRYSIFEPELSKLDLKNAWGVTALSSSNHPFLATTLSFLSSRAICGSAEPSWKPGMTKGSWCFHEDSVMIGGGCGPVGAGHTNGAPQIPPRHAGTGRLPRISCRELRLQSAACGSLWREPHPWSPVRAVKQEIRVRSG